MAFHVINTLSKFGPELKQASKDLQRARDIIDLEVARLNEMSDVQAQSEFGITTLTRAQMLTTLSAAQTQLAHASITAVITQIG